MSDSIIDRCKATRLHLSKMTTAVSAFSLADFHLHYQGLIALRTTFTLSFAELSMEDAQQLWDPASPTTSESLALAAEHLKFISVFTRLITALLKQLHRPLWADCGSEDDLSFTALWTIMTDACRAFSSFPRQWPVGHLPDSSPLFPALQALMNFLLPIASPATSRPWAPPLGREVHADEIRILITPAWSAFSNMCNSSNQGQALPTSIRSLPTAYINTLCFLACEGLRDPLPKAEVANFIRQLSTSIATGALSIIDNTDDKAYANRLFMDRFLTPAVLEVAKQGLIALLGEGAAPVPARFPDPLRNLLALSFRLYGGEGAPGGAKSLFPDYPGGRLRPKPPPAMSPTITTSEGAMLSVMCRQPPSLFTSDDSATVVSNCAVMVALMQSWTHIEGGGFARNGAPSGNTVCLVQITKYCSECVRVWVAGMQEQQRLDGGLREDGQESLSVAFGLKHKGLMEDVHGVFRLACMHASCQKLPEAAALAAWQVYMEDLLPNERLHSENVRRDLLKLNVWKRSAACVSTFEATMRDAHCPNAADVFVVAAEIANRMVLAPSESHDVAALPAMISLSATIRKLVCMYSGFPIGPPTPAQCATNKPLPVMNMQMMDNFLISVCSTMTSIDCMMLTENGDRHAHLRASQMMDMGLAGPARTPERTYHMRRMVAVLLLCVLQTCGWQLRVLGILDSSGRPHSWFKYLKQQVEALSGDAGQLARDVMASSVRAAAAADTVTGKDSDLATMYERLAVSSFQGALLPGCCHLGCTSFAGPSEAALTTQLCSGCRRASYCSVGCQKAAWTKGGHKKVCGKQ